MTEDIQIEFLRTYWALWRKRAMDLDKELLFGEDVKEKDAYNRQLIELQKAFEHYYNLANYGKDGFTPR